MIITEIENNNAIIAELGKRIQKHRINMQLTQEELSKKAGISLRTLANIENGEDCKLSNLLNVMRAENLLSNVQTLIPEEQINPMDILKLNKERQRVRKNNHQGKEWKWGDEQ